MSLMAKLVLQDIAGIITLGGALLVGAVIIFLIFNSNKGDENKQAKKKFFKSKDGYFWGTVLLLIAILFVALSLLPYPHQQGATDEVVTVVGVQWDWFMIVGANENPDKLLGKNEISVPVNKKIKFIVTSGDVTHSFSIYNQSGVLLTQVQAMPQYKNELEYVFTKKGKYTILCLEYCGLAHPFMTGTVHVN